MFSLISCTAHSSFFSTTGSEGESGVVAASFREYLQMLGSGVTGDLVYGSVRTFAEAIAEEPEVARDVAAVDASYQALRGWLASVGVTATEDPARLQRRAQARHAEAFERWIEHHTSP